MNFAISRKAAITFALMSSLSGCGIGVPDIKEPWGAPDDNQQIVKEIAKSVYFSLENAVGCLVEADRDSAKSGHQGARKIQWFDDWGVQIALKLTIDETSALNPGVVFNTPIIGATTRFLGGTTVSTAQQYNLGLGGKLSSHAQRDENISAYFDNKTLIDNYDEKTKKQIPHKCAYDGQYIAPGDNDSISFGPHDRPSQIAKMQSLLIENDLQLEDWLRSALFLESVSGATDNLAANFKQNVIQHHVKFEIVSNGNITPIWKLVRVSANQNGPFFDTNRSRIHDLIITFGPRMKPPKPTEVVIVGAKGKPVKMSQEAREGASLAADARDAHLAAQIGTSVANSIRAIVP